MLKSAIKKLLQLVFSRYEIYQIFCIKDISAQSNVDPITFDFIELNNSTMSNFNSELLKSNINYLGNHSNGFACICDNEIVGVCFFWYAERYLSRNFWPLQKSEAKLVQIETVPSMKGKGVASSLINFSTKKMHGKNFKTLYARIWHSNIPSIKCFKKAGWHYLTTVISFTLLFGMKFKLKLPSNPLKNNT